MTDSNHPSPELPIPHWYHPDSDPLTITRGSGSWVYDEADNTYLDFCSQLYCVNAGHGNEQILSHMRDQLDRIQYVSPAQGNDTRSRLADRIADKASENLSDVIFAVSGSQANELAVQLARSVQDGQKVLTRWQSYHGSTYGGAALSGDPETRAALERHAAVTGHGKFLPPLTENGAFEAASPEELARQAADHLEFVILHEGPAAIAAVVMEPVGGTSGAYPPPADYLGRVREICDEYNVLLVLDEVITGFGRCGDWFASLGEDIRPDMITFAKGCTSAYAPLAGVLLSPEMAAHCRGEGLVTGQTFGGHPVSCAAGHGAIDAYEDGLVDNVSERSPYLAARLEALAEGHDHIAEVRGQGFLWAVRIVDPQTGEPYVHPWRDNTDENPVPAIREHARENGVLVGAGRPDTQLIVAPPFTADRTEIDTAIDTLDTAIGVVFG